MSYRYKEHTEDNHWFDGENGLLKRVRSLRILLSDEEIVKKIVVEEVATPEQVWLCLKSAEILDGK